MAVNHRAEDRVDAVDVDAWRQAIRAHTFANYSYQMGVALWREGSHDAALQSFGRALEQRPDWGLAHRAKVALLRDLARDGEASQAHATAVAANRDYELDAGVETAIEAMEAGDLEGARTALSGFAPNSPKVRAVLIAMDAWTCEVERVRPIAGDLVGVPPSLKPLLVRRFTTKARQCNESGDRDTAVELAGWALVMDPANAPASFVLGRFLFDRGDMDGAAEHLRNALDATDGREAEYARFLLASAHQARLRFEDASAVAVRGDLSAPTAVAFAGLHAVTLLALGRLSEVADLLAPHMGENHASIRVPLALLAYHRGNYADGIAILNAHHQPVDSAWLALGHIGLGAIETAADLARSAVESHPGKAISWIALAQVRRAVGDGNGAITALHEAEKRQPQFARLQALILPPTLRPALA